MKPLSGIRVIDFTTLLPGPMATLILSEAGAEVIKIERPGGEDIRRSPPFIDDKSVMFSMLNRGKRSIEIDIKEKKNLENCLFATGGKEKIISDDDERKAEGRIQKLTDEHVMIVEKSLEKKRSRNA